jgi:acyl-ACP thioesterase
LSTEDLVAPPAGARVFRHPAVAGLADAAPSGRVRLDAIARWLQDAALADVVDSGLDGGGVWVLRRLRLAVARFPRFGDALEVATFCSGTGALVAERRSTVSAGGAALVEAVALWVHLDPDGAHPRPLPEGFESVYGAAAADRRVRARLRHPATPPDGASRRPWRFRAADLDLAGHVNNAVYWQVVEEELVGAERPGGAPGELSHWARDAVVGGPPWGHVELEHRAPADAGEAAVLADGAMRWIVAAGDVVATIRLVSG